MSTTICVPIKHLNDLFDFSSSCRAYRTTCSPLVPRHTSPRQKVLLCHDMKGGYLEDKHTQGCQPIGQCYRFFRWHLIDIFVYFAHELVSIPPPVWIDCAHRNGVQVLGTFITEFDAGKEICRELLSSDENINRAVDALGQIMSWYNFDGYLLNIENPIEFDNVERLLSFVHKLKSICSKIDPNSVIIWYDSVTINGDLKWQNELNELNKSYFDACDGIFLNYGWKLDKLVQSKIHARERYRDVFVGIDVFGRGCLGGGGFNTCEAMSTIHRADLSTAIFAPGWLFETFDTEDFVQNDAKFWTLLEPYTSQRVLRINSLATCFSDGFGQAFFIHGQKVASNLWYHLGLQSFLPNVLNQDRWSIHHQDAYFGGSSVELKKTDENYFNLFKCLLPIESACEIIFVFKATSEVLLELILDNGSSIWLENNEKDLIVHGWQRKIKRIVVDDRVSITDVTIHYDKDTASTIKLGYLSIRPVQFSPATQCSPMNLVVPLVKSIEPQAQSSSFILHLADSVQEQSSSAMILIFARDQFDRHTFLGATFQSYFIVYKSNSIVDSDEQQHVLVLRQYSFDNLTLLNEQILFLPFVFHYFQGFYPEIEEKK